jgi:hypothetical protein
MNAFFALALAAAIALAAPHAHADEAPHPEQMYASVDGIDRYLDQIENNPATTHRTVHGRGYSAVEYSYMDEAAVSAHYGAMHYGYEVTLDNGNSFLSVCNQPDGPMGNRDCWSTLGRAWMDTPTANGEWHQVHEYRQHFPSAPGTEPTYSAARYRALTGEELLQHWSHLNEFCRGGGDDTLPTDQACSQRDLMSSALHAKGYCFVGNFGYQQRWEKGPEARWTRRHETAWCHD